ncbi:hypothetical protein ACPV5O_24425 [Vibrio maritimus]
MTFKSEARGKWIEMLRGIADELENRDKGERLTQKEKTSNRRSD